MPTSTTSNLYRGKRRWCVRGRALTLYSSLQPLVGENTRPPSLPQLVHYFLHPLYGKTVFRAPSKCI